MPRVYFASWDDLRAMLWSVRCDEDALREAKKSLDDRGTYTLVEVWLDDDELQRLGLDPEQYQQPASA